MVGAEGKHGVVRTLLIGPEEGGQRIDNFLLRILKGVPRSLVYRLLRTGEVRVNKGRAKPSRRLDVGDRVRLPPIQTALRTLAEVPRTSQKNIEKTILYEDDRLIVINKPAGVAVHGGSGIAFGVIEALRAARPRETQLELVHRLDRETSGCLMIAKRRSALRKLQALQLEHTIVKHYAALLRGHPARMRFSVEAALKKNLVRGGERVVRVVPDGKASHTSFAVIERFSDSVLVEVTLITGRTHQIRVHAAHIGHPVVGDPKYGDTGGDLEYRRRGFKRLFLHASQLILPWVDGQPPLALSAPLPAACVGLLARLRGEK